MNLEKIFLKFCVEKKFEVNQSQVKTINHLQDYYKKNFERSILSKFLKKMINLVFTLQEMLVLAKQ